MKKMKLYLLLGTAVVLYSKTAVAQTKIGAPGASDASAVLELQSANRGLLLPRLSLSNVTTWGLNGSITVPGMMVYNTNASITGGTGVGVYYWNGTQWVASAGAFWGLTGNAGTTPATNFIGTTDAVDFVTRTNNAERMRIRGLDGFVGIGTSNPDSRLTIVNDALGSGASDDMKLASYGSTVLPSFFFQSCTGTEAAPGNTAINTALGSVEFSARTNGAFGSEASIAAHYTGNGTTQHGSDLQFLTRAPNGSSVQARMTIDESGNVGIGTATPAFDMQLAKADFGAFGGLAVSDNSGANAATFTITPGYIGPSAAPGVTLDVAGEAPIVFGDTIQPAADNRFSNGTAAFRWRNIYGYNADFAGTARIAGSTGTPTTIAGRDASGNVGNVTVGAGLTLAGGVLTAPATATGWGVVGNTGTNPATNFIGTTDAVDFVTRTNNAERMRIRSNGFVGIGTSNPDSRLTIVNDALGSGASDDMKLASYGSTVLPSFFFQSCTGTEAAPGNTAINTALGSVEFSARTNGAFGSEASIAAHYTGNGTTQHGSDLQFLTRAPNGSSVQARMTIDESGNVGIGTATPAFDMQLAKADFGAFGGLAVSDNSGANAATFTITPGYIGPSAAPGVTLDVAGEAPIVFGDTIQPAADNRFSNGTAAFRWRNIYGYNADFAGTARIAGSTGTPTTIAGRDASGNVGNITLGTGLSMAGGVLSALPSSAGWALTGNAGTNSATNFIGTSDNQPLVLRTNNAEAMRINTDGQVVVNNPGGISSFNGAGALQAANVAIVNNDAATTVSATRPALALYNTSGANNSVIRMDFSSREANGAGSMVNIGSIAVQKTTGNAGGWADGLMTFGVGKTSSGTASDVRTAMAITPDLNIGIGTTTPTQKLDVNGTARIAGSAGTPTIITGRDASGNVGNVTLGANLSLAGGVLSATGGGSAGWDLTGNAGTNSAVNYIGTSDAQPLVLRTNAAEQMRITSAGSVGIGTDAPTSMLDIDSGDIQLTQRQSLQWGPNTDERIYAYRDLGYPGANLFLESRENIAFTIDRNNTAATSNTVGFIWNTNSSWQDGIPTELMRLTDAGNLGIGIVTPAYKLDVAGDINASASVRANGVVLTSDVRLKRNISNTKHGLSTVMALRPVEYEKKSSIRDSVYNRHEVGFIAQEIKKVIPSIVTEGKDADKTLAVSYIELIPVLTKAMQEQQAQIETLKTQNAKVNSYNKRLTAEVKEMKDKEAAYAELAGRVKQMEQMLGVKEMKGSSKMAVK